MANSLLWPKVRDLRGRRKQLTGELAKYGAIRKTREWTPDEQEKVSQLESEIADNTSRIDAIEEVMYEEPEDEDDSEERSDDAEDMDDDGEEKRGGSGKRKKRTLKPWEKEAREKQEKKKGEVIRLPDGRQAVIVGNQRGWIENSNSRREDEFMSGDPRYQEDRKRRSSLDYRKGFLSYLETGQQRSVYAADDVQGGYLIAPVQVSELIIKKVDNLLWLSDLATKIQVVNAKSLGVPSIDEDPSAPDWNGEIATVQVDTAQAFGRRELTPRANNKVIKVSAKWLANAVAKGFLTSKDDPGNTPISGGEDLISTRLARTFAISAENNCLNGNGVAKPLGPFTASTRGVSTARDVNTGSTTGLTYGGLINAKYTLRAGYDGKWLISREFMRLARSLVDDQARPLFLDPVQYGKPEVLLGDEYMVSEYAPSTFTSNLYVGIYADWSYYVIAMGMDFGIQILNELFRLNGQIGYLGMQELDGMPTLEDAFVRLKCAS